jgi:hypothetical protein
VLLALLGFLMAFLTSLWAFAVFGHDSACSEKHVLRPSVEN